MGLADLRVVLNTRQAPTPYNPEVFLDPTRNRNKVISFFKSYRRLRLLRLTESKRRSLLNLTPLIKMVGKQDIACETLTVI